jgi:hypothetical protein
MARRPQWWHRLQASKGEVRLAVDLYNRSGHERHLEAFIIHMTLGWLRLLQARIEQRGGDLYERDKRGMAEEAPRRRLGLQTAADPARRGLQGQRSDPGQHHLLHRAPEPNRTPTRVADRDPRRRQNPSTVDQPSPAWSTSSGEGTVGESSRSRTDRELSPWTCA